VATDDLFCELLASFDLTERCRKAPVHLGERLPWDTGGVAGGQVNRQGMNSNPAASTSSLRSFSSMDRLRRRLPCVRSYLAVCCLPNTDARSRRWPGSSLDMPDPLYSRVRDATKFRISHLPPIAARRVIVAVLGYSLRSV
jgi:hypothetical protein